MYRAAGPGWSEGSTENLIQALRIEQDSLQHENVRSKVSARASRITPALAWDHRPVPAPGRPQTRRGIKNVQSRSSRRTLMCLHHFVFPPTAENTRPVRG